jgi:hypothetical protein
MRPLSPYVRRLGAVLPAEADDAAPAASHVPRAGYPLVHPHERVAYQLRPRAQTGCSPVGQSTDGARAPAASGQGRDGTWILITPRAIPTAD